MTLSQLAKTIEKLRFNALCGDETHTISTDDIGEVAELEFLQCLSFLELAVNAARKAAAHAALELKRTTTPF